MKAASYQLPGSAVMVISISFGGHSTPGGRKAARVVNQINHWLAASGPEWTTSRLKAIRVAALQLRAGNRAKAREIYQANSIAYRKGTLIPRGPLGAAVEAFVQAKQPAAVRRWDAVLRCYTAIRLTQVSTAQLDKARRSINGDLTGNQDDIKVLADLLRREGEKLAHAVSKPKPPNIHRLKMFTSTHAGHGERPFPPDQPYGRLVWSLLTAGAWPEQVARARTVSLRAAGKSDYVRQLRALLYEDGLVDPTFSGKITGIQEAGCKLRVVATPNAYTQWLFEPLHEVLMDLVAQMPESCVHDQVKGAYTLCRWLQEGRTVYCFDLSSATDRFPRLPQMALLEGLGFPDYASDLEELCHTWRAPPNAEELAWDYKVGTPMGVYGVFPLFHLSHLLILRRIGAAVRKATADCVLVLGDDVAIADPEIARRYLIVMQRLGVDISDPKTISSDRLAEFAGFVVHTTNLGAYAYRPYKYGDSPGIHAPVNLIHSVGKSVRRLGPYWAKQFDRFQETRQWRNPDLSPLIPADDEGGIRPAVLDTTRLENLITQGCSALDVLSVLEPGGQWSEDPEGYQELLRGACGQLLSQEPSADGTRELLSTPRVVAKQAEHFTVDQSIRSDPLMRVAQPWVGPPSPPVVVTPPDPDDLAETGAPERERVPGSSLGRVHELRLDG